MFQKDKSSLYSHGKRAKDVPVRKSDRKKLLQIALDVLLSGATAAATTTTEPGDDDRHSILHDCFLNGDLYKRTVKVPSVEKTIDLYYRSPTNNDPVQPQLGETTTWPYTQSVQCVWLQMEHEDENSTSRQVLQIPSLALLAVLQQRSSSSATIIMSTVYVPSQVSKYLCRGANLMRAGMRQIELVGTVGNDDSTTTTTSTSTKPSLLRPQQQQQQQQRVVAICVMGNPQPFAVGILQADLLHNHPRTGRFGPGQQGLGVTIVHCYGDDLWQTQLPKIISATAVVASTSSFDLDAGHFGNAGFLNGQLVVATTTTEEGGADNNDNEEEVGEVDQIQDEGPALALDTSDSPAPTADESDRGGIETTDENNKEPMDEATMAPEEVLHLATCKALAGLSIKTDLPMKMSTFYAQHVLPHRPAGTTIELKKTKYKKYGIYVQEQVKNGVMTVGPDEQKDPAGMLTSYDRRHPDVKAFVATVAAEKEAEASHNNENDKDRLLIVDLYRVPHHFVNKLQLDPAVVKGSHATSDVRKNSSLLTLKEVRAIVENYVARESLVAPDDAMMIQLNGPLTDVLFKKTKQQQSNENAETTTTSPPPLRITRKDLMSKWQAKMEIGFALVQHGTTGNDQIIRLGIGKHPVITIEVTRRQSNKYVTKVTGLEAFGIDPDAFAKDASHRFACSSSVTTPNGGNNSSTSTAEVLFQGNLVNELEALLRSDPTLSAHGGVRGGASRLYHLPKNAIAVVLRKGVPARKNNNNNNKR
jgi:translation initiation factor 2D